MILLKKLFFSSWIIVNKQSNNGSNNGKCDEWRGRNNILLGCSRKDRNWNWFQFLVRWTKVHGHQNDSSWYSRYIWIVYALSFWFERVFEHYSPQDNYGNIGLRCMTFINVEERGVCSILCYQIPNRFMSWNGTKKQKNSCYKMIWILLRSIIINKVCISVIMFSWSSWKRVHLWQSSRTLSHSMHF